jgi:cytochrome c biogenesis protein CcdA
MIPGGAEKIKKISSTMKRLETTHPMLSLGISGLLGFLVVLFEFPCTGAPYLAVIALISTGDYASGIPLLLLYNLIFILPLFVIIGLVYMGHTSHKLEKWRKQHRGLMRLGIGLFLLAFGAYLIYTALQL